MSTTTVIRTQPSRGRSTSKLRAAPPVTVEMDASSDDASKRTSAYRRKINHIRRRYERQAVLNGIGANCLSMLLVTAGAAVGLTPLAGGRSAEITAFLGVAIILLEGVSRVLRPALRAGRARRTARELDREFRLFEARGRSYNGPDADAAFLMTVERILDKAFTEEDHETDGGFDPTPSTSGPLARPAGTR